MAKSLPNEITLGAQLSDSTAPLNLAELQGLMREKRFDEVLCAVSSRLAAEPTNTDALYLAAAASRYLLDFSEAQQYLDRLRELQPQQSRALQEQGHLCRDRGDSDAALGYYAQAVRANPALLASWQGQQRLLIERGDLHQAEQIARQIEHLKKLPPALVAATDLIAQGKLVVAEQRVRDFLKVHPHQVEAMRLLADIGVRLGVLDDAEFLLESAVQLAPDNLQLRVDYLQTLRKRQKFAHALAEARYLLEQQPSNPQFKSLCAIELMQTGDYPQAVELLDQVLQQLPEEPVTLTTRGHALKTAGTTDEAIDSYQRATLANPRHGEAWYALANLKTYRFNTQQLAQMAELVADESLPPADRVHLYFALGKGYEDSGDYARSFECYAQGNGLKKAQSRYSAQSMSEELAAQRAICTPQWRAEQGEGGCSAADPIFIVGLPRAGSTLLEQILSSHSQVDGTLELPNILALAQRLRRGKKLDGHSYYPAVLQTLNKQQRIEFGEQFIADTQIHRSGAPFFIDKMPNNFRHIGLIKSILPNAKIIDARRAPLDCCFSGFKQLFAEGQEFTYDLANVGRYYRDYVELMAHWQQVYPGEILHVQYEEVVHDIETQVRRILDYCGLPFEQNCIDFHTNRRAVRTASSEQVRQPLNRAGLDQWQHYSQWLEPLYSALGEPLLPSEIATKLTEH